MGSELSYTVDTDLMDNTEYHWQVTATDLSGATFTTDLQSFTVNTENDNPTGFTLVSPEDATTIHQHSQLLVWSPSTDLDGDEIEFDVYLNGTSMGMTNHNYFYANDLMEDDTYDWYVIATDNNGGMTETNTWTFMVNAENTAPTVFALLSPGAEALFNTTSVSFEWESSTDSDPMDQVMYHLELHTGETHMAYDTDQTTFIVEGLMDNSVYHWSVTAHDMNGAVTDNTDGPRMFIVNVQNDPPMLSSLVAPLDSSIQTNLSPLFYWTEASDPDPMDHLSYHLILTHDIAGSMVQDAVIDSNSFSFEFELEDNSDYYWKVNTLDSYGLETIAPDYIIFYTDDFPEPPLNFTTLLPENNAAGIGTEVEFIWNSTTDPDPLEQIRYQLIYATNWDDSSTYIFSDIIEDTSLTISVNNNSEYHWKVQAMDRDEFVVGSNDDTPSNFVVGTLSIDGQMLPEEFALHQNYPNPFNPTTQIKYDLPQDALVTISIYDLMGRSIKSLVNTNQPAGYRSVRWDATNNYGEAVSAGMYICNPSWRV
jgi:hypothetical protein